MTLLLRVFFGLPLPLLSSRLWFKAIFSLHSLLDSTGLWCFLPVPIFATFPSFSLPDELYDPTDVIWRQETPIWGDDWSHSLHRRSPSSDFPRFSSAVRQMSEDLCTVPGIISLSPLSLAYRRDWHATRSKWSLARILVSCWWHLHISLQLFWPQPMAPWQQVDVEVGLWEDIEMRGKN